MKKSSKEKFNICLKDISETWKQLDYVNEIFYDKKIELEDRLNDIGRALESIPDYYHASEEKEYKDELKKLQNERYKCGLLLSLINNSYDVLNRINDVRKEIDNDISTNEKDLFLVYTHIDSLEWFCHHLINVYNKSDDIFIELSKLFECASTLLTDYNEYRIIGI